MRHNQPNQPDDPGERNCRRRQQCSAENDDEANPFHWNPKCLCLLIAKGEQIDAPALEKEGNECRAHEYEREVESVK